MKHSDTLPSVSSSLQAEVGVTEFSAVPAYDPGLSQASALDVGKSPPYVSESISKAANRGNPGAAQKPSNAPSIFQRSFVVGCSYVCHKK